MQQLMQPFIKCTSSLALVLLLGCTRDSIPSTPGIALGESTSPWSLVQGYTPFNWQPILIAADGSIDLDSGDLWRATDPGAAADLESRLKAIGATMSQFDSLPDEALLVRVDRAVPFRSVDTFLRASRPGAAGIWKIFFELRPGKGKAVQTELVYIYPPSTERTEVRVEASGDPKRPYRLSAGAALNLEDTLEQLRATEPGKEGVLLVPALDLTWQQVLDLIGALTPEDFNAWSDGFVLE